MPKNLKGWVWETRDAWVFCKGDGDNASATVKDFKRNWPGAQVRTEKRTMRIKKLDVPVTIVYVREKQVKCTCGEAHGRRPPYLTEKCAYCVAGPEMLQASLAEGRRT